MTVHNWLSSFNLGEERTIPSNCMADDLIYYAATRFAYYMLVTNNTIKRICPTCQR